jgi:hypothetical protein
MSRAKRHQLERESLSRQIITYLNYLSIPKTCFLLTYPTICWMISREPETPQGGGVGVFEVLMAACI